METTNKTTLLNHLENQVESHLQQAIREYQNLTDEILLKPSNTGGWSIAECLAHLNFYGNYYLPLFENGLQNSPDNLRANTIKSSWLGRKAIDSMNPETGKKKHKAFKAYIPTVSLDAKATVAEYINQQERMLKILRIAYSKDIQQIKIPISIAKFLKLNLGDALQFLIVHNERHIQQANRNL
jgi:DinB superfamily